MINRLADEGVPHRVLVLDEPTLRLDPAGQRWLRSRLVEARANGVAVLFSSHQPAFARRVADRAIMLSEGRVVADGPLDVVMAAQRPRT